MGTMYLPDGYRMLCLLGFRFGLDWDGELQIEAPESIDADALAATVRGKWADAIKIMVKIRADNARCQCVGGPFNGKVHDRCYPFTICLKVKPREWAAYYVQLDGRAMFAGLATSEAKARKLAMSKQKPLTA